MFTVSKIIKKKSIGVDSMRFSSYGSKGKKEEQTKDGRAAKVLTGDGAEIQVVPDHLLELVVQGAFLELQAEVVTQISIQHLTWRKRHRHLGQCDN